MITGVQALIFNKTKNKALLIKRGDFPVWTLPGGRIERGESLSKAIKREVYEETGLRVKYLNQIGVYKVWYFPFAGITYVYTCKKVIGKIKVGSEAKAVRFWPLSRLPRTLLPYLKKRIEDGSSKKL